MFFYSITEKEQPVSGKDKIQNAATNTAYFMINYAF